jgi:uncharacterized membrane protein (UPF0127 family)
MMTTNRPTFRFRSAAPFSVAALCLLLLAGCEPPSSLPTVQMQIGNDKFTLEVADDNASRETGLMNRDSMGARHGMLFVFDREQPLSFWMKNTRIPLDILFVDSRGRVITIKTMKPFDLTPVPSEGMAKYAIELNAGAARDVKAQVGDVLNIPTAPSKPATSAPADNAPASAPADR